MALFTEILLNEKTGLYELRYVNQQYDLLMVIRATSSLVYEFDCSDEEVRKVSHYWGGKALDPRTAVELAAADLTKLNEGRHATGAGQPAARAAAALEQQPPENPRATSTANAPTGTLASELVDAVAAGRLDEVRTLLERGADPIVPATMGARHCTSRAPKTTPSCRSYCAPRSRPTCARSSRRQ